MIVLLALAAYVTWTLPPAPPAATAAQKPASTLEPAEKVAALDLPTLDESGAKGFEFETWFALNAPPGVPKDIIDKLHKAAIQGMADPEIKERFDGLGLTPMGITPEQFLAKTKDQYNRYGKVIREQNIKPE